MGWTILLVTCISAFWFAVGAGTAAWMMHCGRTGSSPLPAIHNPFHREPKTNGEVVAAPHPRVGIPSRAGN